MRNDLSSEVDFTMSDECLSGRNDFEQKPFVKCTFGLTYRRLLFFIVLIFFVISVFYFNFVFTIDKTNLILRKKSVQTTSSFPKLSRTLYLFLCENQHEMNIYSKIFPTVSSDAIFYCWRENCNSSLFHSSFVLHVQIWSNHRKQRTEQLISLEKQSSSYEIKSRIFIINEKELNRTGKGTWKTSRNDLYQYAINQEIKQKWRWSYYIFADGDVHLKCPLNQQLLTNPTITDHEFPFASHFISFVRLNSRLKNYTNSNENNEEKCYLLFDSFLLSISPAIATVTGSSGSAPYNGLLTRVTYHIDAMFNAIHHDALQFVLPYCPKYDHRTWWTSQAIFVYRSICLYGHSISFDGCQIARQTHRPYPRNGDPWSIIETNLNFVPKYLVRLQRFMGRSSSVSSLVLHNYAGWNIDLTSRICRENHTKMNIVTCVVGKN